MSSYLFAELEEDARRKDEALEHARQTAPPPEARGWQLRVVGENNELEEGWNEPIPQKRDWVVHHYYVGGQSLCGKYFYTTAWPPKPHFQAENPAAPHYRDIHTDWLCKICLVHRMGQVLPPMFIEETRVVSLSDYTPYQVYIGGDCPRYKLAASKWANPDKQARKRAPKDARADYRTHILTSPGLVAAFPELRGRILACDCKEHDQNSFCHGNVLVELVEIGTKKALVR